MESILSLALGMPATWITTEGQVTFRKLYTEFTQALLKLATTLNMVHVGVN